MKRLILFLGLILLSATMFAQVTARTALQRTLPKGVTYFKYTCVAADTCGVEQDTLYFEILSNKNMPITCNARVEATRSGTSETYGIDLEGKVFENDTWTTISENNAQTASISLYEPETSMIDTINTSASTGTTAHALPGSGDNFYRYFRVFIDNDGTCAAGDRLTINYVIFKLYER